MVIISDSSYGALMLVTCVVTSALFEIIESTVISRNPGLRRLDACKFAETVCDCEDAIREWLVAQALVNQRQCQLSSDSRICLFSYLNRLFGRLLCSLGTGQRIQELDISIFTAPEYKVADLQVKYLALEEDDGSLPLPEGISPFGRHSFGSRCRMSEPSKTTLGSPKCYN